MWELSLQNFENSEAHIFFKQTTSVFFDEDHYESPVYQLDSLLAGHEIPGPSIIIDKNNTIVVEPHCVANVTIRGDVIIKVIFLFLLDTGNTLWF